MDTVKLKIDGMHCQSCVARVRRAIENVAGTAVVDVKIGSAEARAESPAPVIAAVEAAGYTASQV